MKILALEFSSERRSVAVAAVSHNTQAKVLGSVADTGALHTKALALVEAALQQTGVALEAIEAVVVGLGPGSYTGIRAAIALAQGWQLARGVRLLGLSSFEALAAQALAAGLRGRVHLVADAQRNEFYLATYDLTAAERHLIEPLRLATLEEIRARLAANEPVLGPEAGQLLPGGRTLFPDAAALAQVAAGRTDFVAGERLEPIYLRPAKFVKAPPPRCLG